MVPNSCEIQQPLAGELVFLFVEERQDRIDNLNREISGIQLPAHFKVDVECGTFAENLTAKLNKLTPTDTRSPRLLLS